MPFLNWLRKKSEINKAETEPAPTEKLTTEEVNAPESVVDLLRQATAPAALANEPLSAEPQPVPQVPDIAPEPKASDTAATTTTPQLSVPIGAFYPKLPAHLLAPVKPDLTRFVQIAEEDLVIDHESQEATLPLSILSLSCPEIFVRAVDGPEDIPVTFSLRPPKESESPPLTEESISLQEPEAPLPAVAAPPEANLEPSRPPSGGEREITLRLRPIFSDFPPELEPPSIHSFMGTEAEITLPLGLILAQLAYGRVVVPAELFCKALPNDLKPYFETIDPAAEIPIPLQEIFTRLPAETIKLREDQETDRPEETISTPFSVHAEEDAERFSRLPDEEPSATMEPPQPKDEPIQVAVEADSTRLRAIFMTDEPLDLAKTIGKVAELPGLRSCILSSTEGLKIAGNLGGLDQEKAISVLLPELFQRTRAKMETLGAGTLETITLYYDLHQLSTFVQGKLCLTVLHDHKPFKPGVREKIQAVISELAALSTSEKPL
jgi:predicted regulator of Ras-like GTPase activity (Roadblock/LC7/MglB family)